MLVLVFVVVTSGSKPGGGRLMLSGEMCDDVVAVPDSANMVFMVLAICS